MRFGIRPDTTAEFCALCLSWHIPLLDNILSSLTHWLIARLQTVFAHLPAPTAELPTPHSHVTVQFAVALCCKGTHFPLALFSLCNSSSGNQLIAHSAMKNCPCSVSSFDVAPVCHAAHVSHFLCLTAAVGETVGRRSHCGTAPLSRCALSYHP